MPQQSHCLKHTIISKDKTKPEVLPIILPKIQTFLLCMAFSSAVNSIGRLFGQNPKVNMIADLMYLKYVLIFNSYSALRAE